MRITEQFVFFHSASDFPSQWFPAPFSDKGLTFKSTLHYMMFQKAVLSELRNKSAEEIIDFLYRDRTAYKNGDKLHLHIVNQILDASTPKEAKDLCTSLSIKDENTWNAIAPKILYKGNYLKLTQNPNILQKFISLGSRTFAEASPHDKVYGIGMTENHPDATNPSKWKGKNIEGNVLTQLSKELCKQTNHISAKARHY